MQKLRGKRHVFPKFTVTGYILRNVGKTVNSPTEEKSRKCDEKVRSNLLMRENGKSTLCFPNVNHRPLDLDNL